MNPEPERPDRTATTATTGLSASQADLSTPLTERAAEPEQAQAEGGENASHADTTFRSRGDNAAPQESDQMVGETSTADKATEGAGSASAAVSVGAASTRLSRDDEDVETRGETRGDGRLDAAARDGDAATGSSTSITLHNEFVLTANGGADGATPSPDSAWSEMSDRLNDARTDIPEAGDAGAATEQMADRMDDVRDRIDGVLAGGEANAGSDLSARLEDLRDQAEDFLAGSDDETSSSPMNEARTLLDQSSATDRQDGVLQAARDLLESAGTSGHAADSSDSPISEASGLDGLEAIRADAANLLDRDVIAIDSEAADPPQGFLAALFDGDLAPSPDNRASITPVDDLGLDDGDVNLPEGLAINSPGEGFAFDPFDAHA